VASLAVTVLGTLAMVVMRKVNGERKDSSQMFGSVKQLNNHSDHPLKSKEVEESIDDYEGMFTGAREKNWGNFLQGVY